MRFSVGTAVTRHILALVTSIDGQSPDDGSVFGKLTSDERRSVMAGARSRRLAKDQILFQQDEPAEALYLVGSGRLKLTQLTAAGHSVAVRFVGVGEVCAAIAVLDGKAYPFTAIAAEPTSVRLWTAEVLRQLFLSHPRLQLGILEIVGVHTRQMLDKVRELATEPVSPRLARTLLRLARLGGRHAKGGIEIVGLTQQDLGELAGATLHTVNRVLSGWESAGVLERGREKIVIRALPQLEELAQT